MEFFLLGFLWHPILHLVSGGVMESPSLGAGEGGGTAVVVDWD